MLNNELLFVLQVDTSILNFSFWSNGYLFLGTKFELASNKKPSIFSLLVSIFLFSYVNLFDSFWFSTYIIDK
ncbi:hypothetical protein NWE60_03135 [Mycoplasmopsis felis]|nr:hypothetical protein [Mycoplasmopsis felis]WAM01562.1 hypothetical protein NWE60_03135 [Mycoplasmopsis felis]